MKHKPILNDGETIEDYLEHLNEGTIRKGIPVTFGQEEGQVCNRDNCKGIMKEYEREGCCTCFQGYAPCGYCCQNPYSCNECNEKADQP